MHELPSTPSAEPVKVEATAPINLDVPYVGKERLISRITLAYKDQVRFGYLEDSIKAFLLSEMKAHAPQVGRTFEVGKEWYIQDPQTKDWHIYAWLDESAFLGSLRKDSVRRIAMANPLDMLRRMGRKPNRRRP